MRVSREKRRILLPESYRISSFGRDQAAILGWCKVTPGRTRTCAFFRRELAIQRL
jgi:hypothetical protein